MRRVKSSPKHLGEIQRIPNLLPAKSPQPQTSSTGLASLRQPICQAVRTLEPGAEIILFGSRARGTATTDSDWDLLILLDGPVNSKRKRAIRHRLYEVEWDRDAVLTSIIIDRSLWNGPRYRASPIHRAIERDGIPL